jgi:hypothetical protein
LSSAVMAAMLNRDAQMRNEGSAYNYQQQAYPPTIPPPANAPLPQMPEPAPMPAPVVAAPPPVYVSTPPPQVSYFYNDLSPYGTWVEIEGAGWCWQPSVVVVNHAWRPYCDSGHWVYTDAGWYWQSDYSWGWAPFHYGRWSLHPRHGWVWLPDTAWAPAWVTWRMADDRCGWAPLPPHADFDLHLGFRFNGVHVGLNFDFGLRPEHFTFVAMNDFRGRDLGHRQLPHTEVTRIYNRTTIINNYTVNNNTIVNRGIPTERIVAASHTPIHKVAIRDVSAPTFAAAGARRPDRNEAVVYRPHLEAPARPVKMVAQKVDERHPIVRPTPAMPVRSERNTPSVTRSASPTTVAPRGVQSAPSRTERSAIAPKSAAVPRAPQAEPQRVERPGMGNTRPNVTPPAAPKTTERAVAPTTTGRPTAAGRAQPNEMRPPVTVPAAPRPTGPASAVAPRPEPSKPISRPVTPYRPEPATPASPSRTSPEVQRSASAVSPAYNNRQYYPPKSSRQAAEIRGSPSANARPNPAGNTPPDQSKKSQN